MIALTNENFRKTYKNIQAPNIDNETRDSKTKPKKIETYI